MFKYFRRIFFVDISVWKCQTEMDKGTRPTLPNQLSSIRGEFPLKLFMKGMVEKVSEKGVNNNIYTLLKLSRSLL